MRPPGTFDRVLSLARRNELSASDATCLQRAQREKVPLATFDEALRLAAQREGVEVLAWLAGNRGVANGLRAARW